MKFLKDVSVLTFIVAFLSGMAIHWIFTFNWSFHVKALCVALLLLTAFALLTNDLEKMAMRK